MTEIQNFAVLIDADNVASSNIKGILEEITKSGNPTIKRIYGDFTSSQLNSWKAVLLENAITPIQQYAYTTGKNSTDSALIIDAMDILHKEKVDGFCIVSSDSDFTRLVTRLRESSKMVIGIGEKKTPQPFIVACDKFIYIEILNHSLSEADPSGVKKNVDVVDKGLISMLTLTINDLADENGWAYLGEVGSQLMRRKPDFDPRNYGFDKLTPLVKSLRDFFEIDERSVDGKTIKHIYVRKKVNAPVRKRKNLK